MKTLYLVRHAHTQTEAPTHLGDHERALSDQGSAEAEKVAGYIESRAIFPDFVLSSSSVRTLQTARIIMGKMLSREGSRIETRFDRKLYLASADIIINDIQNVADNFNSLMVVGHNPGIAELAMALSKNTLSDFTQDFKPGTIAVFQGDITGWHDINAGTLKLIDAFAP